MYGRDAALMQMSGSVGCKQGGTAKLFSSLAWKRPGSFIFGSIFNQEVENAGRKVCSS